MADPSPALPPRLYLNHDVSKVAAEALRREGFDVVAAEEAGMADASDADQLRHATEQGRALVSFNVRDYPSIHSEYLREGRGHCGIVLSRQLAVRDTIRALRALLTSRVPDELKNHLAWL